MEGYEITMVIIAMNPNKEIHVWHGGVRAKKNSFYIYIFFFVQRYQIKNLRRNIERYDIYSDISLLLL